MPWKLGIGNQEFGMQRASRMPEREEVVITGSLDDATGLEPPFSCLPNTC